METVLRMTFVYLFVMVGLRIVGKRAFGQMGPADLVVLMFIPELFQQAIAGRDFSLTTAIVAISTLLLLALVTETLTYRFPRFGSFVNGSSVTVVSHGYLRTERMHPERVGPEEVLDAMHRAGLDRMEQVKWAVLYPDGTIAIVPWAPPDPGRDDVRRRPLGG